MSITGLKSLTNEELRALLTKVVADTADGVLRGCEILYELETRSVRHGFSKDGAFQWFREVATGRLHPTAALMVCDRNALKAMMRLPLESQRMIATGETLPVVEWGPNQTIVTRERRITEIDGRTLQRVIGTNDVRDVAEQTRLLRESQMPPSASHAKQVNGIVARDGKLVVGRTTLDPSDLIDPLLELGFKLVRIEERKAA